MNASTLLLAGLLALVILFVPVFAAETQNVTEKPTAAVTAYATETLPVTPPRTPQVGSGEVETPIIRQPVVSTTTVTQTVLPATTVKVATTVLRTTTPVTTKTTVSPAVTLTTNSVTTKTTAPVVTVTVIVYRNSRIYEPDYYYPRYEGYPYYPSGSLTVTSDPSGAIVIIDGYSSGTTPWVFTGLATGWHTVEVDYAGYEAYTTNIYVDSGETAEVNAELTPLVEYGTLVIGSTPGGADVYVDGNYQGISPVTVSALAAGSHQIELHLAGYQVLTDTESITAGQGTVADLTLAPLAARAGFGTIDITSDQPGALVYLDGNYKGSMQGGTTFNIISVAPGPHSVLLHLPGYTDVAKDIEVTDGQISSVTATFGQPAAVVSGTGSLIVTSAPAGAQVTVDGQFRGIAPVTIYDIMARTHIINLQLSGYDSWSTSTDVAAGQIVEVPATLVPAAGATTSPTRAGLPMAATLTAIAAGSIIVLSRNQGHCSGYTCSPSPAELRGSRLWAGKVFTGPQQARAVRSSRVMRSLIPRLKPCDQRQGKGPLPGVTIP